MNSSNFMNPSVLVFLASAMALSGCTTVPETGRSQLRLISEEQEVRLGLTEFSKIKESSPITEDARQRRMIERVGKRIARVAPLPDARWEFVMFDKPDEANAFCLPGGKVGVYTGILPVTESEAGLATVISHEVAHAVARHGAERVSQELLIQTGGQLLDVVLASQSPQWHSAALAAYGIGGQVGVLLPYSRTQELEADYLGLLYLARAGYDPREATAFWKRFGRYQQRRGGNTNIEFLSTHPLDETRIEAMEERMGQAVAEYRKSGWKR